MSAKKINYVSFFSKSFITTFISGVNHFLTISGSQIIVITISGIKMPIFVDVLGKMLSSAKNRNFYRECFVTKCTRTIPIFMITVFPIQKLWKGRGVYCNPVKRQGEYDASKSTDFVRTLYSI